ncbi:MAG: SRPBCC family protein [Caulobacteraceae bacterium]
MIKIEHRLGVQAPAEAIWAAVSDIAGWGAWNPLYPRAQGVLAMGERLTLDVALPGQQPRTIRPVVVDWVPNEQIHWSLTMASGLVRTTRYIEIEALTETGCIFSNGEIFGGLLGPLVARRMRGAVRAGFQAMGEAVKARAEEAWRGGAGQPI